MAADGIQNYVDMAAGLTKATRAKAQAAAKTVLATAGLEEAAADATDRVTKLAEEVIAASRANRELMGKLVATEVDKAAARLGFVRADELEDLRRELAELRMSMAHESAHGSSHAGSPDVAAPSPVSPDLGIPDPPISVDTLPEPDDAPLIKPIAEPPVPPIKKAATKKAPASKAPAGETAATKAAFKKVAAASDVSTPPAKKSAAKKSPPVEAPLEVAPEAEVVFTTSTPVEDT